MGSDKPQAGVVYSLAAMADQSRTTADCAVGTSEQSKLNEEERAQALVTELTRFVNVMANAERRNRSVADALMREHRTLQQSAFGLMLACVKAWADDERGHDARNEWTVEKCKTIVGALGEYGLRTPFI